MSSQMYDGDADEMTWNQRMSQIGWWFSGLCMLALITIVIGFFANWFDVDGISNSDQVGLSVAVNTDEVAETAGTVANTVSQGSESAELLADTKIVDGKVMSVGAQGDDWMLSLRPNPGDEDSDNLETTPLEILINEHTSFEGLTVDSIANLKAESPIRVVYREGDKNLIAMKVEEHELDSQVSE